MLYCMYGVRVEYFTLRGEKCLFSYHPSHHPAPYDATALNLSLHLATYWCKSFNLSV